MTRKTQQRRAIRHVFEVTDRPLTPQEVLGEAQKDVAGLGIATVYRNLKALHENGWLKTVELPGEPNRYEPAEMEHHHHFHCETCDIVFDVPGCPGGIDELVPGNYRVRRHELTLYGSCGNCSSGAESA